ncbi:MAG: phosphoribosylformimino-5-aminoimidazole carboxamide ribotide isomerase [Lachnospiraceae bacterium]|nr:phosphoribosylformimino-5-aminoimidazole carboxamide ribotide isomerase [Lachnospiraceae bacterium]
MFRPCIDIHNGKVKQLVGGSLKDEGDYAKENFVASQGGEYFANLYKEKGLKGGHIIILNHKDSEYYEATKSQAMAALKAYPFGMQIGGGITADNAKEFIDAGASHVIVTSYVFKDGHVNMENLTKLVDAVSKDKVVLDLSCRKKDGLYYIVTDRWQKFTDTVLNEENLNLLSNYCDELLVHGVDVEGKGSGMDLELVKLLSKWKESNPDKCGITYAGGISSIKNIDDFKESSKGMIDYTIGSALDLFGGNLSFEEVLEHENS